MFKMYFVKTETPNVYNRIDALARILFDRDVYLRTDYLTQKQSEYYQKAEQENLTPWNEIIGFTTDYDETVTIFKPIPEMIQTAKNLFDIDLCFVDERPDIPYNKNAIVDIDLAECNINNSFCYWLSFGKLDMTDTLAIIDYNCDVYNRIRNALGKYHFGELQECVFNGYARMTPKLEETMRKDFKENFNINLHVTYSKEYTKIDPSPETEGTAIEIDDETTQRIAFSYHEQWNQTEYQETADTPFFMGCPDVPIDPVGKIGLKYITIYMPDQKNYDVTFRDITVKNDETHPSIICFEGKNIMPYVDEYHKPFDIRELLEKLNNPTSCHGMYIRVYYDIEYIEDVEILPEDLFKRELRNGDTVIYS